MANLTKLIYQINILSLKNMMNIENHNLNEIEGLSQRGQTLSIIDLINAKTLTIDMTAYALYRVSKGASFITAARPGNAGKTTLLACLLTFLPIETEIVTISNPSMINKIRKYNGKLCVLCHEIGSGPWYGYLWGKDVGHFFDLMNYGHQIASCIHADTLDEMYSILVSNELGVSADNFSKLDLIFFMHLDRQISGYRRRVSKFYERNGIAGKHKLLFSWDDRDDTFNLREDLVFQDSAEEDFNNCKNFIEMLVKSGNTDFRWVRNQVIRFLKNSSF